MINTMRERSQIVDEKVLCSDRAIIAEGLG